MSSVLALGLLGVVVFAIIMAIIIIFVLYMFKDLRPPKK